MKNCLLHMMRPISIQVGVLTCVIALITGVRLLIRESSSLYHFITTYYTAIPLMIAIILFLSALSLTSSVMNIALSMGARRKDYFAAMQLAFLILAAYCWLLQFGVDQLAIHFAWEGVAAWNFALVSQNPAIPVIHLLALSMGSLLAAHFTRNMAAGTLFMIGGCVVISVLLFLTMFVSGSTDAALWGDLPWILPVVAVFGTLGCEVGLFRSIRKAVVV